MNPRDVTTLADARRIVEIREPTHVKIGVTDLYGVLRGKYISREKFLSGLDNGLGFCDVVLGWDLEDLPIDGLEFTGWHKGFPDAMVRVVPESCRDIPFEDDTLIFLCEFEPPASEYCPRSILQKAISKSHDMGFNPYAALEYEFFMFEETPHSVREKAYRDLTPWTPGAFGYSALRNSVQSDFYHSLLGMCEAMDMPLEGLHTETGPGVLEACITVDKALEAADKAALFKTFTKVLAQKSGLMATFMAKWSANQPGQSGHIHISLKNGKGDSVFYGPTMPHKMSPTMRQFIAGQQALMPELMALVGGTVNAYSRMVPGLWAPTNATWGVENRTCAIRAIPGSEKSQRVEYRIAAADTNPYLALAVALSSGLYGIEQGLELQEPTTGDACAVNDEARRLPATLWDAAQRLRKSEFARSFFGDKFVEHYATTREWEERAFRKHVTDWELERYFEII